MRKLFRGIEFACGWDSTVAMFCGVDGTVFDRLGSCVSRMVLCNYYVSNLSRVKLYSSLLIGSRNDHVALIFYL